MNEDPKKDKVHQTVIINQNSHATNTVGLVGFILAILAYVSACLPIVGFVFWVLGAILSVAGLFKKPRGLAIAGVIISFIGVVIIVLMALGIFGLATISESLKSIE